MRSISVRLEFLAVVGCVCMTLALVLAWCLVGGSSRTMKGCFPNPQYLLKAHLDFLMMTGLLFIFFLMSADTGFIIENAGVPAWWPAWCLAYDVAAAAGLAWLLRHGLVANDVRA